MIRFGANPDTPNGFMRNPRLGSAAPTGPASRGFPTPNQNDREDEWEEKVRRGPPGLILPQFLPYFDDYSGETPAMRQAYRRMALGDPNIKAALLGKILAVAALDLKVHPPSKKNPRDQEVAEFTRWVLADQIGGPPKLVAEVLLPGLIDGYSVCEKVHGKPTGRGKWGQKSPLVDLAGIDVGNDVVVELDDRLRLVSIMGLRFNAGEHFDPADFVVWSHMPLFGRVTATSDCRAAYRAYWVMDTAWKLRLMMLQFRAGGLLVGKYTNPTVQQSLQAVLKSARTHGWISLPAGAELEVLNMAGAGDDVFKSAMMDAKHDAFFAISGAVLQNIEGDTTDGRGDTTVHLSEAELRRWWLARELETILNGTGRRPGLIQDIVDPNYVVDEYPRASLGAVDQAEVQTKLAIYVGAKQLGLDLSKAKVYEDLDIEPPDEADPDDRLEGGLPAPDPTKPGGAPGEPGTPGKGGLDAPTEPQKPPTVPKPEKFGEDASGHEHKDKGPGGGQFTGDGGEKAKLSSLSFPEQGERVAQSHHKNMRAILGNLNKGKYSPEDADADAQLYHRRAESTLGRTYTAWHDKLRDHAEGTTGKLATGKDWEKVSSAVNDAYKTVTSALEKMTVDARNNIGYRLSGGAGTIRRSDVAGLEEAHDELVKAHHEGIQQTLDALDAYKAAHGAAFCERFDEAFERLHPRAGDGKFGKGPESEERKKALHESLKTLKEKHRDPALASHQKRALRERMQHVRSALIKEGWRPGINDPVEPKPPAVEHPDLTYHKQLVDHYRGKVAEAERDMARQPSEPNHKALRNMAKNALDEAEIKLAQVDGTPPEKVKAMVDALNAKRPPQGPLGDKDWYDKHEAYYRKQGPGGQRKADELRAERDHYYPEAVKAPEKPATPPNYGRPKDQAVEDYDRASRESMEARRQETERPDVGETHRNPPPPLPPKSPETPQVHGAPLFGSRNMIKSAAPIQHAKLQEAAAAKAKAVADLTAAGKAETAKQVETAFNFMQANRDARYWLNNRGKSGLDMLRAAWSDRFHGFAEWWDHAEHDVSDESRDAAGKWTGDGADGKTKNMNNLPAGSDDTQVEAKAEMLPDGRQEYPFVKIAADDPVKDELIKLGGLWDGKNGGISFRYCNFSLKGTKEERLNEANRRIAAAKENATKEANKKAEAIKDAKPRTGKEELPKGQDVYYRVQWSGDSLSRNFKSKNFQNDKEEAGTSATHSFKDLMQWIATIGGAPTGDVEIVAFRGDHVGMGDDNEPLVRPTEELARYRNPDWKWSAHKAALADKAGENEDEALRHLLDNGWREVSTKKVKGGRAKK